MRSALIGVFVGLVLLIAPSAASAVPDAGCPGPSDTTPFTPLGDRREAETFTAVHTGTLQSAALGITNLSPNDPGFLVQILSTDGNGVPVNGALASTTVPNSSVPAGPSILSVGFSPAAVVSAGQNYAVAISRPGANFLIPTWQLSTRSDGTCPGASYDSLGANFAWAPEPSHADILFQTDVDPVQVSQPAGGAGADFTLVQKHNRLFARVPGPGRLIVDDAKRGKHGGSVKRTKARARRAGDVPLRIELTDRAIRRAIKRRKINVLAAVTYRPTGGTPSSLTFRIRAKL